MAGKPPKLTAAEEKFVRKLVEGSRVVEAARSAFGWKCEPETREFHRAKTLYKSKRIQNRISELTEKAVKTQTARQSLIGEDGVDVASLRKMAVGALEIIRDDQSKTANTRLKAIKALEKLHDPTTDVNLIMKWIDLVWRFAKAHCPACHSEFPLWKIYNKSLEEWRVEASAKKPETPVTDLERRLVGISYGDKRKKPHSGQVAFLEAAERHLVGLGAARAGKSWLMATFGFLALLLPGVEIWILARVYEDARSEQEYLMNFIKSAFFPYEDSMVRVYENKQSGEFIMLTKWGSELRIRSSKSKGSIIGRELELALIAEPGWVPAEIFEEVRARMSSRLGRILAFGTPKGTSGIIGRMMKMTGRDPVTRKIVRRTPEERRIANGSPWNVSMFVEPLRPEDNPEYVISEIDAARQELTDIEFASEFRGEMTAAEGAKYPMVTSEHLTTMPRSFYEDAVYILGIDQGPRNFGAVLTAYNGDKIVCCAEYFDSTENTMRRNLIHLMREVPFWIRRLGGARENWKYTITDRFPLLDMNFEELKEEGYDWPSEVGTIPVNNRKANENWRRETSEFVNNSTAQGKILWEMQTCEELHNQVMEVEDRPIPIKDIASETDKGWKVNDVWREDHVLDAWLFTMVGIYQGSLLSEKDSPHGNSDAWSEQKAAFEFQLRRSELQELAGMRSNAEQPSETFQKAFGRPTAAFTGHTVPPRGSMPASYDNES